MLHARHRTAGPRRGHTLLELLAAAALTAAALVPALRLTSTGLVLSREIDTRNLLTTLCVSKLEEQLAWAAAHWTNASTSGSFAGEGFASLRYELLRSDAALDGGIPDQLMLVRVTVWHDVDGNAARGADELQVRFRSKIAKMSLYQDVAQGN